MQIRLLLTCCATASLLCLAEVNPRPSSKLALHDMVRRDPTLLTKPGTTVLSYADVVEGIRDSVVTIQIKRRKAPQASADNDKGADKADDQSQFDFRGKEEPPEDDEEHHDGGGSGLVVTEDGLILTNNHVVEDAEQISIRLRGQAESIQASIVGRDPVTDIAIIKVRNVKLVPATLGDSAILRPGDVVLAMGSPFGLEQTVTMGIVSATGRSALGFTGMEDFIQTDAAINPGNSGGPLMDGKGRVIGINTAHYNGQNIGFAVPLNLALKVADDLLAYGLVVRGFLGIHMEDMTPKLAVAMGLPKKSKGVVVTAVEAGEPAAKAGILPGDIIVQVNGRHIDEGKRFRLSMASLQPGANAAFIVKREGKDISIEATLGEPPELAKAKTAVQEMGGSICELVPGLTISSLTTEIRNRFLLPETAKGVVVLEDFKLQGSSLTLRAGDLILSINGVNPQNAAFARTQVTAKKASVLMLKVLSGSNERFVALPSKP